MDQAPKIVHGFPVEAKRVPAIGEEGTTTQSFCPLIKGECLRNRCMFWVELFAKDDQRIAHCAYYWNTLQLVDIKQALMSMAKDSRDAAA